MARSSARSKAQQAVDKRRNPQGSKTKRRPEPKGPAKLDYTTGEINTVLFPTGQRLKLSNGETIHIKPWSIEMFGQMAQRIPDTMTAALPDEDGNTLDQEDMAALFVNLVDEVITMVALTLEWDEAKVHEVMCFEELVAVATVVWDVCIMGPMGKMGGLMGRVVGGIGGLGLTTPSKSPTPPPSSSPQST